jgi:hypothetical protein
MYAVYLPGPYQTNVEAETPEEAAAKAVVFFRAPFWKGPKPKPGDYVRVTGLYGGESVMVKVAS